MIETWTSHVTNTATLSFLVLLCLAGCGGTRLVARPVSLEGYRRVELRDVAATGEQSVNVEVEGVLGPLVPQEVCGGLVTFPLLYGTGQSIGGVAVFSGNSGIVSSLPRARYGEVRDLQRYLWVDTIEPIAPIAHH